MNDKDMILLLKKYGNNFTNILKEELVKAGKNASGDLIRSLRSDVKGIGENINISITSLDYLKYVDKGRRAGSYPPIKEIEKWCDIRSIPRSAAFAISRSIFKFGIKPTNVISKSIKVFSNRYVKNMENDISKLIEKKVIKRLKKIK